MASITPTVGRMILFHPMKGVIHHSLPPDEVRAATIAHVHADGKKLNLAVIDRNGTSHAMPDVPLIQEGEDAPENGYYAEWMPEGGKHSTKAERLSQPAIETSPFSAAAHPVVA